MKQRRTVGSIASGRDSWELGQSVVANLQEWVPRGSSDGQWKNTGHFVMGWLVNGPDSYLLDREKGSCWYISPEQPIGRTDIVNGEAVFFGSAAPWRISERPFSPYAEDPTAHDIQTIAVEGQSTISVYRFAVEAIAQDIDASRRPA